MHKERNRGSRLITIPAREDKQQGGGKGGDYCLFSRRAYEPQGGYGSLFGARLERQKNGSETKDESIPQPTSRSSLPRQTTVVGVDFVDSSPPVIRLLLYGVPCSYILVSIHIHPHHFDATGTHTLAYYYSVDKNLQTTLRLAQRQISITLLHLHASSHHTPPQNEKLTHTHTHTFTHSHAVRMDRRVGLPLGQARQLKKKEEKKKGCRRASTRQHQFKVHTSYVHGVSSWNCREGPPCSYSS